MITKLSKLNKPTNFFPQGIKNYSSINNIIYIVTKL